MLQGPHILDLVTRNIVEPAGLVVHQQKTVLENVHSDDFSGKTPLFPGPDHTPDSQNPDVSDNTSGGIENSSMGENAQIFNLKETLWLSYPGRMRCEAQSSRGRTLTVFSDSRFVKVKDNKIAADRPSVEEYYLDILRLRDRKALLNRLADNGVDVNTSSLQRFRDKICYVVGSICPGKEPASSLWVDKDTFFPVRYIVRTNQNLVEIIYENWHRVSRTWYPMDIKVSLNKVPCFLIDVESFRLEADFPLGFFDIDRIYKRSSAD